MLFKQSDHETILSLKAIYKVLKNKFHMKMWNASQQKIKYMCLEEITPQIILIVRDIFSRPLNFKGQVVAQGGE